MRFAPEKLASIAIAFSISILAAIPLHAQMTDIPRLQSIIIVEDGMTFPTVANQSGTVQITPGRLLKERNLQSLAQLLETYVGWPADASSVEAIGRAVASWGKGNAVYFNLLAPISIPPDLTLTLYPKAEGPSFLTYVQPKVNYAESSASSGGFPSSYYVDMANAEPAQQQYTVTRRVVASPNKALESENQRLTEENSRLAEGQDKLKQLIAKLAQRINQNNNKPDTASQEYARNAEAKNEKLQSVVSQLSEKLKNEEGSSAKVRQMEAEKEKLRTIIDNLADKLRAAQESKAQIQKLEAEKDQLKSMLMNLAKTAKKSQISREKVQQLEASKAQMRELVESLSLELKNARNSSGKLTKIEGEKNKLQDILQKLSAELQKAKAEEKKNDDLIAEKEDLKAKLNILARKLRESQNSDNRVKELEQDQMQLRAAFEEATQKLQEAQSEEGRAKEVILEKSKLQQTVDQMSHEVSNARALRVRVAQLESDKRQLRDALKELSQELDEARGLQSRIQQVEVEKNKLHATLEGLSKDFDDAQTTKSRIREIETDRDQLDGQLQELSGELDHARIQAQVNRDDVKPREESFGARSSKPRSDVAEIEKVKVQTTQEESDVEDLPELKPVMKKAAPKTYGSPKMIQKVVIAMQGQSEDASLEPENIVVRIAQLPEDAIDQIKSSARILLNKPLAMDDVKRVGIEIGRALKAYGLNHYDVVLPQQNITEGTLGIEIRKIVAKR